MVHTGSSVSFPICLHVGDQFIVVSSTSAIIMPSTNNRPYNSRSSIQHPWPLYSSQHAYWGYNVKRFTITSNWLFLPISSLHHNSYRKIIFFPFCKIPEIPLLLKDMSLYGRLLLCRANSLPIQVTLLSHLSSHLSHPTIFLLCINCSILLF